MLTDKEIDEMATIYSSNVSTSHRVHADLYIGKEEFNTVTSIVKAAYVAGAKAAREIPNDHR